MSRITPHPRRRRRVSAAAALALVAPLVLAACSDDASSASGDGSWEPDRDIDWIVPYSAGGGFDTYSRGIAEVMQRGHLPDGVNVVIRNTPPLPQGISQMFNADADGYTIGILPMPAAIAQEIQEPDLAQWKTSEFTVLGQVDENGYVVYVPSDSEFETIEDLIAAEDIRAITVEQGSSSALAGLATIQALDLDAQVTYGAEGSAEVVTAALRGDADFFVYGSTDLVGFVESGDIRPLMYLGTEDQLPENFDWLQDVPTAEEAGFPDLAGAVTELRVIVGPPDLPEPVAEYLRGLLADTMADEEFITWAEEADRPIVPRTAEETEAAIADQITQMEELVPQLADG
ncbi:Bug family tripartite tricarboxylate transporter substrate binding protein [Jiangella endophytica]|uniref:Bug family tripartite tricarboxylate transporter substrate binding protein n=1 Tax=Jiangella endophytica TaxID=1623398 RepID=UPI00130034C6|nr:tripartite tricarboxylate transporter substrate-binding protein [Jiangella endophytica]